MTEEELRELMDALGLEMARASGIQELDRDLMKKMSADWHKWLHGAIALSEMADRINRAGMNNILTVALGEAVQLLIKIDMTLDEAKEAVGVIYKHNEFVKSLRKRKQKESSR